MEEQWERTGTGLGKEEEQLLAPRAINQSFAGEGDGPAWIPVLLCYPSGKSWGQEAPHIPDLQGLGVGSQGSPERSGSFSWNARLAALRV